MKFVVFFAVVVAALFCAMEGANAALASGAGGGAAASTGAGTGAGIFSTAFNSAGAGTGPVSVDSMKAAIIKLLCSNDQLLQQIQALSTLCKTLSSDSSNPFSMLPGGIGDLFKGPSN